MITHFADVGLTGRKHFACACGKRLTRQKRFYQTLNPFNKDAAGNVKTQAQIFDEVCAEFVAWKKRPDPCNHQKKEKARG